MRGPSLCSVWMLYIRAHDPVRVPFLGFRCRDCGAVATTEEGLIGAGSGHVDPARQTFRRESWYMSKEA